MTAIQFRIEAAALDGIVGVAKVFGHDEVFLQIGPDGIHIAAMHAANVCLIVADVPLLVPPPEPIGQAFAPKHLKQAADALGDLKELDVVWDGAAGTLTFKSGRRRKTIKSVRSDGPASAKIPDFSFEARVVAPADWLKRCLKGATGTEYKLVELTVADGSLTWKSGDELGSYEDVMETDSAPAASGYDVDFIRDILGLASSKEVVLRFGNGTPLKMEMGLPVGVATALLAPMVKEN